MLVNVNIIRKWVDKKEDSRRNRVFCDVECSNCGEIKTTRFDTLKSSKYPELCHSCINRDIPFKSLYNYFINTNKFRLKRCPIEISFKDFLEYTKIKECHYCGDRIDWQPYRTSKSAYINTKYFLDRKDSSKGYNKDNIVVCCTRCNRGKANYFSYDEWYGMTEYLRRKNFEK